MWLTYRFPGKGGLMIAAGGTPDRVRRPILIWAVLIGALSVTGACSNQPARSRTVTIALVDRGWFDKEFREVRDRQYAQFTAETGIKVRLLPGPESAVEQLRLWEKLLGMGPDTMTVHPDVFGIDVIWPGILAEALLDLKPYVAQDLSLYFPDLVANLTINGKLVALPNKLDFGLLYYRSDLLQKYGFQSPPETWNELEQMAARIQGGERAEGKNDFWGYVWEGAISEALTCNALEWQASEGGGRIIDGNQVSVNNAGAIHSWERAAEWVGSISPPGVTSYKESDAMNLWLAGDAAFMRNWTASGVVSGSPASAVRGRFGVSLLPRGQAGRAEVFGGDGYAVSKYSAHPREAIALVRFLCSRRQQAVVASALSMPPTIPDLFSDESLVKDNPHFAYVRQLVTTGMVSRPSSVTATRYTAVSEAYSTAVHSVLKHESYADRAAARLQKQISAILNDRRAAEPPFGSQTANTNNGAR
jgi:trehalose/maltose transport system substrate-binding protein